MSQNYIMHERLLIQEELHMGLGLFGGEQPVGGLPAAKMKKVIFLYLRIQKKYEEITKET